MVTRRHALVALALLPQAVNAQAADRDLRPRVVVGDDSVRTSEIMAALRRRYPALSIVGDPGELARPGQTIVAVGPAGLAQALKAPAGGGPLVSLFVSATDYDAARGSSPTRPITAIYAEASPEAQLQLAAALVGRRAKAAALVSEAAQSRVTALRAASERAGIALDVLVVSDGDDPIRVLARADPFAALIALPDRSIYNPTTLRVLLESTYRRGTALVGFTASMVQAGAAGAPFANLDDTLTHLDELLLAIGSGRIPDPQYPRYWRVVLNDSVVRSLGLNADERVRSLGSRPAGVPR